MRPAKALISIFAILMMIPSVAATKSDAPEVNPDSLVHFARSFIGTPYGYGQSNGKRFDCSGFTFYIFSHYGHTLARTSRDQYLEGDSVAHGSWAVGDLVFFSGRSGGQTRIGHVGIVVECNGDEFDFIHASTSRGVIVSHSTENYYASRYIGARRVLPIATAISITHPERPLTTHERIFGRLVFHPIPDLIRPHEFPIKKAKKRRRK